MNETHRTMSQLKLTCVIHVIRTTEKWYHCHTIPENLVLNYYGEGTARHTTVIIRKILFLLTG